METRSNYHAHFSSKVLFELFASGWLYGIRNIFDIIMWRSVVGHVDNPSTAPQAEKTEDDEWETDPDFVNDVSEEEQRWGSLTVEGSGRTAGAVDMKKLVEEISRTTSAELGRLSRRSSALGVDVKSESPHSGNNNKDDEIKQKSSQESDVTVTTDQKK